MRTLTLLLLILFLATSVGMSVIARGFVLDNPNPCCPGTGNTFSIFHLEFPKSTCTEQLIKSMGPESRRAVRQHLDMDYLFMVGCYLGIICLNLWVFLNGKDKGKNWGRFLLLLLCCLQPLAWGLDIAENMAIERWIRHGNIDVDYSWFNIRSYTKFAIGIAGALFPILAAVIRKFQQKEPEMPITGTTPAT